MKERRYGIDLLRILSMYLICILHVAGQGGVMIRYTQSPGAYYAVWVLETAAYCAVNVYGMISGYVGVSARHRPSRIVELWFTVFWYSALGTLIGVQIFHHPLEEGSLYQALLPASWKTYWYFSAYVGVFVLAPYLSKMVKALTDAERKALILSVFLLFTCLTMVPRVAVSGADWLNLSAGYSFVWLALLYLTGASIRCLTDQTVCQGNIPASANGNRNEKGDFYHRGKLFYLLLYLGMTLIAWGSKILIENHTRAVYGKALYGRLLSSYVAPTTFLAGLALLLLFSKVRIQAEAVKALIRFLSPLCFSVYLVQVQPYFWNYYLKGRYSAIARLAPLPAMGKVLLTALLLYLFCLAVDLLRALLFRILSVRKLAAWLTDIFLVPFRAMTGLKGDA